MEEEIEIFTNYVKDNYDFNNDLIKLKYYHSLRVALLMIKLGKELNLDNYQVHLAFLIGLFHDLGRFKEVLLKNKFDNLTFDHGAYSNKILFNDNLISRYNILPNEYLLIRKAIYYHNKKEINASSLNEILYCNMIRDMDKLDIIYLRSKSNSLMFNTNPTDIVYNNYVNNEAIDLHDIKSKTDSTILYLSFIKDLYFDKSYDMALESNYLDRLVNNIKVDSNYQDIFNYLVSCIKKRNIKTKVKVK